jgi:hypothetical protein
LGIKYCGLKGGLNTVPLIIKYRILLIFFFFSYGYFFQYVQEKFYQMPRREAKMNLEFWLPAMFLLGIVTMGVVGLFFVACEKI